MKEERYSITKEQLRAFKKDFLVDFTYSLIGEMRDMNEKLDILTERLNVLTSEDFGRMSEKKSVLDGLDGPFFNEAEVIVAEALPEELGEPDAGDVNPCNAHERKPHPKGRRDTVIKELPEREEVHVLGDGELMCPCGGTFRKTGSRTVRLLEFHPAYFEVVNHVIARYECMKCGTVKDADRPPVIFEGSLATPSLLAGIATAKYINAMPFDRMERSFADNDAFIRRQTMARWMVRVAEIYFSPIYERLKRELLTENSIIHADETTVTVSKDGRKAGSKSYMWVYTDENSPHPVVIYEYHKTRAGTHPKEFLEGFTGWLCCDGYEAYHGLGGGITVCGCWAHARRHYSNAVKALKGLPHRTGEMSLSEQALTRIGEMFELERSWKGLPREERQELRDTELREKMESYFDWVETVRDQVPAKSETGKGFTYSLNQKEYLLGLLTNPDVPLDNSEAERKIRNFVISRKNFVLIDTVAGAEAGAIMFSIAETLRANGLKAHEYFRYLLEEMPKHMGDSSGDMSFIEDLLPWSDRLPAGLHKKQQKT